MSERNNPSDHTTPKDRDTGKEGDKGHGATTHTGNPPPMKPGESTKVETPKRDQ